MDAVVLGGETAATAAASQTPMIVPRVALTRPISLARNSLFVPSVAAADDIVPAAAPLSVSQLAMLFARPMASSAVQQAIVKVRHRTRAAETVTPVADAHVNHSRQVEADVRSGQQSRKRSQSGETFLMDWD